MDDVTQVVTHVLTMDEARFCSVSVLRILADGDGDGDDSLCQQIDLKTKNKTVN